jgi:hypothetical protein
MVRAPRVVAGTLPASHYTALHREYAKSAKGFRVRNGVLHREGAKGLRVSGNGGYRSHKSLNPQKSSRPSRLRGEFP